MPSHPIANLKPESKSIISVEDESPSLWRGVKDRQSHLESRGVVDGCTNFCTNGDSAIAEKLTTKPMLVGISKETVYNDATTHASLIACRNDI